MGRFKSKRQTRKTQIKEMKSGVANAPKSVSEMSFNINPVYSVAKSIGYKGALSARNVVAKGQKKGLYYTDVSERRPRVTSIYDEIVANKKMFFVENYDPKGIENLGISVGKSLPTDLRVSISDRGSLLIKTDIDFNQALISKMSLKEQLKVLENIYKKYSPE